jgi:hypothetical protein
MVSNTTSRPSENVLARGLRRAPRKRPKTRREKIARSMLPRSTANKEGRDRTPARTTAKLTHRREVNRRSSAPTYMATRMTPMATEEREVTPRYLRSSQMGG